MLRRTHEAIVAEMRREHARERRELNEQIERLLDRVMVLADKPPLVAFAAETTELEDAPPGDFFADAYPDLAEAETD